MEEFIFTQCLFCFYTAKVKKSLEGNNIKASLDDITKSIHNFLHRQNKKITYSV